MKTVLVTAMINYGTSLLGTPYIYGANGGGAFDCSGVICELLKSIGVINNVDRSAQGLYFLLVKDKTPNFSREPEIGDIVFYGKDEAHISHVAMVYAIHRDATEKKIMVLEAGGGDRNTLSIADANRAGASVRIRPLFNRSDALAIISPFSKDLDYIKM